MKNLESVCGHRLPTGAHGGRNHRQHVAEGELMGQRLR